MSGFADPSCSPRISGANALIYEIPTIAILPIPDIGDDAFLSPTEVVPNDR